MAPPKIKRVRNVRGPTARVQETVGRDGQIIVDSTKKTVTVHDGATPGGFPLAREVAAVPHGFVPGTAAAPGLYVVGDPGSGLTQLADGTLSLVTGGEERLRAAADGSVEIAGAVAAGALTVGEVAAEALIVGGEPVVGGDHSQISLGGGTVSVGADGGVTVTPALGKNLRLARGGLVFPDGSVMSTAATGGSGGGGGLFRDMVSTAANRPVTNADTGLLIECTNAITLSVDAMATLTAGWTIGVLNSSAGTVLIDPAGVELINGSPTMTLNAGEWAIVTKAAGALKALRFSFTTPTGPAWSSTNKDADITLTEGGRRASLTGPAWGSILSDVPLVDATYFEVEVIAYGAAGATSVVVGIAPAGVGLTDVQFTANVNGFGYARNGNKLNGGAASGFGSAYTTTIVGVYYQPSTGKVWFALDGVPQGGGDPAAGTNPAFTVASPRPTMFPAAYMDGNPGGASVRLVWPVRYQPVAPFHAV